MMNPDISPSKPAMAILACMALTAVCSCATWPHSDAQAPSLRQKTLLDADWLFNRGEVSSNDQAFATSYNDSSWQHVQLPHDYMLDGTYEPPTGSPSDMTDARRRGYLPVSVGWYRRHLLIPQSAQGRILTLEFGGVFRDCEVWFNGQSLGKHPSGYTGFFFDITKAARYGEDNVIAVRLDPREREGWWYEGAGIYRHVYLHVTATIRVATYGTYVISEVANGNQGGHDKADLTIQTTVENDGPAEANCEVVSEILDPAGGLLKTDAASAVAQGEQEIIQHTVVVNPKLWSLESPQLYTLRTTVLQNGRPVDCTRTPFGIRSILFDAPKGFFLNGKHVEIKGCAAHQDMPAVGIAVPDSLQEWRVRQLKAAGCNGWRTAHNPPNDALLDACDRLGMLVMDENRHLGDSVVNHSPPGTAATNLSGLAWMIQRDRNHPSIIMWSMCNEERLQSTAAGARIFSAMMDVVHRYDRTRPVTSAMNNGWLTNGFTKVEDLIGVNYNIEKYDQIHRTNPGLAMFGSECANYKTTRAEYLDDPTNGWCSAYNQTDAPWQAVAQRPFMAGLYVWTGFDYKGEPNPFGWPDISNNTGLLDVCGFPKDKSYYFKSWWSDEPMVHLMPMTWNWPGKEGQQIRVLAFSNAKQVELFLNDRSLGMQTMPKDRHLEWQVPYQPGRLVAKAYTNKRLMATDVLETTGTPASIQLSPERKVLHADEKDTLIVPVSILDANGRLVSYATNRVRFRLSGPGRILGVGNGNPADHDPDRADQRDAFHGHCIAVIQAGDPAGALELTASSPGLKSARLSFRVR